ncbi:hypothetical protein D3C84_1047550 [compost metagenome]
MQCQGEGQKDEQGMAKIATVADVLLLDGESGEQQQEHGDARLGGDLPVGECQDIAGREECQVWPGHYEHERFLVSGELALMWGI